VGALTHAHVRPTRGTRSWGFWTVSEAKPPALVTWPVGPPCCRLAFNDAEGLRFRLGKLPCFAQRVRIRQAPSRPTLPALDCTSGRTLSAAEYGFTGNNGDLARLPPWSGESWATAPVQSTCRDWTCSSGTTSAGWRDQCMDPGQIRMAGQMRNSGPRYQPGGDPDAATTVSVYWRAR
jgi:hypothetical protein